MSASPDNFYRFINQCRIIDLMTNREVVEKIIDVTERSARGRDLSIVEISSMDEFLPHDVAERLRGEFVKYKTPVRQITNHKSFKIWTDQDALVSAMKTHFVPRDVIDITTEELIFDDTVAVYRLKPTPMYHEITDAEYARQRRKVFNHLWSTGDVLLMSGDGSTRSKQYMPYKVMYGNIPVVIYPAKDDAVLTKAFDRNKPGCIESYVLEALMAHDDSVSAADMIIAYVWNDGSTRMVDPWIVNRNKLSDDSGFLYDCFTLKEFERVTNMGVSSGNSLITFTAEEMLLRELILVQGLSFKEAADRSKYRARFPLGYLPDEEFYFTGVY
jgi:hypothetical protein